jgi:uncharacterized protein YndB with AHSA1/START domain
MTANTAELGQVIDTQTLRMERTLNIPIDKVWSFLVDPAKRARWLAGGSCPARAGDTIELRFDNDTLSAEKAPPRFQQYAGVHPMKSRVLKVEPPHLLVMTWQEGSPHASEVSFELVARGEQTQLTLVHSKLARRDDMLNVAGGWHAHLDLLEDVLAERTPRPFWSNFGEKQAAYDRLIPAA